MKIKLIIAAVGLLSFTGTFILGWLTNAAPQGQSFEEGQAAPAGQEADLKLPLPETSAIGAVSDTGKGELKKTMTDKQLKSLTCEVREKLREYKTKLDNLKLGEQRLQMTQNTLKKDIEELDNLRIELASAAVKLKSERQKLEESRIKIANTEKTNLVSIAATYDKMDPTAASKILTTMSLAQNSSADDAVKIVYYMAARTRAKLLAELVTSEPKLAAYFCKRLKQIVEKE